MHSIKKLDYRIEKITVDHPLLPQFCKDCHDRGFENNNTISKLKMDHYEVSAFFGLIHNNRIKCFGGVHNFDYDDNRYYRIGFRGVSLYDDSFRPTPSKDWMRVSLNSGVLLPLQMIWTHKHFGKDAKCIITSNSENKSKESAGKSHQVDRLAKMGKLFYGAELLHKDIEYAYTIQNVWLLDLRKMMNNFIDLSDGIEIDNNTLNR